VASGFLFVQKLCGKQNTKFSGQNLFQLLIKN